MAVEKRWTPFPHAAKQFEYPAASLRQAWDALHAGDCEPWPDAAGLRRRLKHDPSLAADAASCAEALQQAWRDFHRGAFQAAYDTGMALGPLGASVAIKAGGIHATHLVADETARVARYQALAALAEDAIAAMPDDPNAHYRRAFALGRYSQGISVARALQQGLAGKVRDSLEQALKLAPQHAEAHTALGLYHAEIIAKVGAMIGGVTYGAKAATGLSHLERAIELTPAAPIAHIEYGNGLMLLYGSKREDEAAAAYETASRITPRDAMEKLDVEYARAQLE